ncbi:hypothetical protein OPW41_13185 [Vibrio europaeus]|nr:hypothetical protein [Vibrio europaeus]MDC5798414.1 hypothetical protein [Vibrio europaeus]
MVDLHPFFLSLKKVIQQHSLSIDVYIFGSALYERFPNDIDILVIYTTCDELLLIKSVFFPISLEYPLDIYYMTSEEASELDFINTTKAVPLEIVAKV